MFENFGGAESSTKCAAKTFFLVPLVAASQASTNGMIISTLERQHISDAVNRDRGIRSEHITSPGIQRHFSILPFLDL